MAEPDDVTIHLGEGPLPESSEAFPVFPVFVVVDTSGSMAVPAANPPIAALKGFLPELKNEVRSDPTVGEVARIAMVRFSDTASAVLPLSDLAFAPVPDLDAGGGTNFAAAFRTTRTAIADGIASLPKGTRVYQPVVFFLSDGEHLAPEDWRPALDALRDRTWKYAPEVVAFGFGDANAATLQRIATRFAFMTKDADPATQLREIIRALIGSIRTTSKSFRDPSQQDGLHMQAPTEFFTPLAPITD